MSIFNKGYPFANVGANQTATCSLPMGMTILRVILALGGTTFTKAHILDLKLKANGRVVFQATGPDLDKLNKFRGMYDDVGFLTLDFSELKARTINGERIGGLDTSVLQNATLEVKIGGATAPSLDAFIEQDDPQYNYESGVVNNNGVQFLCHKLLQYPFSNSVSGKMVIDNLPKAATGTLIKRLHILSTSGADIVDDIEIKVNNFAVFDATRQVLQFNQKECGRVPQAGLFTVDFVKNGNVSEVMDTRNVSGARPIDSFIVKPNFNAAPAGYIYLEVLDAIGNL